MIGRVLGYTAAAGATVLSASYGMSTEYVSFISVQNLKSLDTIFPRRASSDRALSDSAYVYKLVELFE